MMFVVTARVPVAVAQIISSEIVGVLFRGLAHILSSASGLITVPLFIAFCIFDVTFHGSSMGMHKTSWLFYHYSFYQISSSLPLDEETETATSFDTGCAHSHFVQVLLCL